jgi:hypothetical protein
MMASLAALKQKFQINDFQALRALSRYNLRHGSNNMDTLFSVYHAGVYLSGKANQKHEV